MNFPHLSQYTLLTKSNHLTGIIQPNTHNQTQLIRNYQFKVLSPVITERHHHAILDVDAPSELLNVKYQGLSQFSSTIQ